MSDITFDMVNNKMEVHQQHVEPWRVTLVDTGDETMTGGRLKRVAPYLAGEEAFCFTYGDGVGDVDITALVDFHRAHGKLATLTATQPPGRFGALSLNGDQITSFKEKPMAMAAGSTAVSSCYRPKSSIASPATQPSGSANPWKALPMMASFLPTFTGVSGNPWTPCATRPCLKTSGPAAKHPGKSGHDA
jgi:NDP-sugar pyrophosphorylase family protein